VSPRISIIACARWETPYISEWLLYHRAIGFDHVYLCCNDDDPAELYREVLPFVLSGFVTFWHLPYQGQQFHIYMRSLGQWASENDWVMFLDIDEFLRIPRDGSVTDYVRSLPPDLDCVHVNWLFFGNNGYQRRPGGSVLTTYTRRSARPHITCKTLTRTGAIDLARIEGRLFFWHDWEGRLREGAQERTVLGMDPASVPHDFIHVPADIAAALMELPLVCHYAFKSREDFAIRIARGVGGDFTGQLTWKSIEEHGGAEAELARMNEVEDRTLAVFWTDWLRRESEKHSLPPRSPWPNLALRKPADQSSICDWSLGRTTRDDAANAVSGRITGTCQQHTDLDDHPWWQVDLEGKALVHEIRVFNRMDSPGVRARLQPLALDISADGTGWQRVLVHQGNPAPGGIDGDPLRVSANPPIETRFLRLTILRRDYLHLDQVEVYGEWPR
jgi:hypothetical protein